MFLPRAGLGHNALTYVTCIAGMTGDFLHTHFFGRWGAGAGLALKLCLPYLHDLSNWDYRHEPGCLSHRIYKFILRELTQRNSCTYHLAQALSTLAEHQNYLE
jgi:hypothetical protein